jgi:2-deoxy-D-gluconate 3-dehydrogenase
MTDLLDLFDLTGRVAIVTGGAGLLGAEFSKTLAEGGAQVVITDINEPGTEETALSLNKKGYKALGLQLDVTSQSSVHEMVEETISNYGRIDILVNSAALDPKYDPQSKLMHSGSFEDYPLDLWQSALDVNLTGVMLCCQAVSKVMLVQGGGVIINIASIYGLVAPDQRLYKSDPDDQQYKPAYYSVTKSGLLGFTKYLAAYYAGKNIRVNAITPGGVFNGHEGEFLQKYNARTILGRMAEKDEINGALLFLASDASKYMTGANLVVDGGWTAL